MSSAASAVENGSTEPVGAVAGPSAVSVPSTAELHYLNRLGSGYTRQSAAEISTAGAARWLEAQLSPDSVKESGKAKLLPTWFAYLNDPPATKWANSSTTRSSWSYITDLGSYSLLRQVYSTRQLFENMVGFWSNHLHVDASHEPAWTYRKAYDDTIRSHALGTFEQLLISCALHPAMLLYLDTYMSVKGAPNENQGRELLELHTVGREAGYSEQMVKDSAKILSGHTVDVYNTWRASYDVNKHTTGPVRVLGFKDANAAKNGADLTVRYLKYLAHHPATATRIATKLCQHFVCDKPSASLVSSVAAAFTSSGTDIKATLRALVSHPEFLAHTKMLVRTPIEDFVATARVLGVDTLPPRSSTSFAHACIYTPRSTLMYQWPRPDGPPLGNTAWSGATRVLNSFRMHWELAAGYGGSTDAVYRKTGADWLPAASVRLDAYADHLSRVLLGKPADRRLIDALVDATGYPATTNVTASHEVAGWLHFRVMAVFLDSPDHMHR